RQADGGAASRRSSLSLLPPRLLRFQFFFQEISKRRAERRVLSSEETFTLETPAAAAERLRRDVHQSILHRKQSVVLQHLRRDRTQRRVIVENVDPTAERSDHEIVFAFLNYEI